MEIDWTQEKIQSYIDNGIKESSTIEYKSAEALGKSGENRMISEQKHVLAK